MNEHEKFAEELIERGLARAGEVEPLAGLEERLLGKLEAEPERRMKWWWMAAPVAAVLLLVALIYWPPAPVKPVDVVKGPAQPQVDTVTPPKVAAETPRESRKPPRRGINRAPAMEAEASPRQEVFPSPAGLSDEERVLIALVRRQPSVAAEVAQKQAERVQRLEIEPLKIEPVVPETNGIQ
jgi:hypothetical protein